MKKLEQIMKSGMNANLEKIHRSVDAYLGQIEIVVFCGAMPYTLSLADSLLKDHKTVYYWDRMVDEGSLGRYPMLEVDEVIQIWEKESRKALFVSSSRSSITYYKRILEALFTDPFIISFEFLLCMNPDLEKSGDSNGLYSYAHIYNTMQDVYQNIAEYQKLYHELPDELSKEILERILMYRLTFDIQLHEGIKSSFPDYLDEDVYRLQEGEVVVSAGGGTGDTCIGFLESFEKNRIQDFSYYLFEPLEANAEIARKNINDHRVVIENMGIGSSTGVYSLFGNGTTARTTREQGGTPIKCVTIDEYFYEKDIPVTLIKMDIEGAETEAIEGAEKTIKKYLPKLALCIYHKPSDILAIWNMIQLYGEGRYQYYIRAQRNSVLTEYVLYAIPRR